MTKKSNFKQFTLNKRIFIMAKEGSKIEKIAAAKRSSGGTKHDQSNSVQPKPCGISVREISAFAKKVAEALNFKPRSALETVVEYLGGEIKTLPFSVADSKRASITVEEGGKFTITLTPILFPLQKRMSIAHELGHLFLHSRYGEVALQAHHDSDEENDVVEDEAHEFACEFLMPTKLLRKIANFFDNDTIKIAAYFMVPEPIVRQRMASFG